MTVKAFKKIPSTNSENLPTKKSLIPDGFADEFNQRFKEESVPILYKVFQKTEEEGIPPNSFYEASNTLIPRPKTSQEKKTYRPR